MLIKRIGGLLRDAWWVPLIIVAGSVFIGSFIRPVVGVVTLFAGMLTIVYFAILRYDDEGKERKSDFKL